MKVVIIEEKVSKILLVWNLKNVWGAVFSTEISIFTQSLKYNSTSCRFSDVWLIFLEHPNANQFGIWGLDYALSLHRYTYHGQAQSHPES